MSPKIQAILDTALEQVRAALLEEASQAVRNALTGDDGPVPIPYSRGTAKPGPKPKAGKRPKGAKRTPEELEQITKNLLAAIRKKPGQRIEEIARAMGNVTTKDLALPVIKLWDQRAISTKGQKRATRYFPK
jgi:hypothetical protein